MNVVITLYLTTNFPSSRNIICNVPSLRRNHEKLPEPVTVVVEVPLNNNSMMFSAEVSTNLEATFSGALKAIAPRLVVCM
jgi:hypothetical protein